YTHTHTCRWSSASLFLSMTPHWQFHLRAVTEKYSDTEPHTCCESCLPALQSCSLPGFRAYHSGEQASLSLLKPICCLRFQCISTSTFGPGIGRPTPLANTLCFASDSSLKSLQNSLRISQSQ